MTIHYQGHGVTLHHGDCLDVLRTLPDASVDSVVTDPPYGLEFMGKEWDAPWKAEGAHWREASRLPGSHSTNPTPRPQNFGTAGKPFQDWCEQWARECLRVLKPGGHMLAFGGTRTWHRLACAVEDAGFEVRDSIAWLYGSGFPKSLDVSKAIDKAAGVLEHEGRGFTVAGRTDKNLPNPVVKGYVPPAPATPDAERWQGWGTALKPAFEPIVVARKPLIGTVAANVTAHGTGALNIDGCRIGTGEGVVTFDRAPRFDDGSVYDLGTVTGVKPSGQGRWPANVVLDPECATLLDEQSGDTTRYFQAPRQGDGKSIDGSVFGQHAGDGIGYNDTGGASRYFYVAKAPTSERPRYKREGGSDNATTYGQMKKRECNVCGNRTCPAGGEQSGKPWPTCGHDDWSWVEQQSARDEFVAHPTVKPLSLMRWLVRLVTPPGGTVLEPFAGSGTTVEACIVEGFDCIAIEKTDEYLPLTVARIHRQRNPVEAVRLAGDDLGLFAHIDDEVSAGVACGKIGSKQDGSQPRCANTSTGSLTADSTPAIPGGISG